MIRNTKFQIVAVLCLGLPLGYWAATAHETSGVGAGREAAKESANQPRLAAGAGPCQGECCAVNPRQKLLLAQATTTLGQTPAAKDADPLPSWNKGPARQAILDFVRATTEPDGPNFVPPTERIATFDEDGTTWVEHPMYTEVVFALDRLATLAPQHPEWKDDETFRAIISGDHAAMRKLTSDDLMKILAVTHTGVTTAEFTRAAKDWLSTAKHPRWKRLYTDLAYQPMLEVMRYLRANGFRTYIVTGGTQPFVRSFADSTYGIPPEHIIGTAVTTQFDKTKHGNELMLNAKLLLNNNYAGKAEDIFLFTSRRPTAAFGNTAGDQQMLEYAAAGDGARLAMLLLHDDAQREYAYGPANGLPDTKVGAFSQSLYDEAERSRWTVISMKRDWKRIFVFDE